MTFFHMSTWNVDGKGCPGDVDQIVSSPECKPEPKHPHIVCVQQAKFPVSNRESANYRWLCAGESGSAVLISKQSSCKPGSFEQICEQICVAEVAIDDGAVIKVISCYIPPSTDYLTEELWSKLVEVIKKLPCNVTYFLAGDFNAEIGSEDVCTTGIHRGAIGRKLHHKTSNDNGTHLKKLILNCHGKLLNTFGGSNSEVYTYKNGTETSQRSYIVVPCDRVPLKSSQQECRLMWRPDYKHAVVSKFLKPMFYEKFSQLDASEVIVSSWNVQGASTTAIDKALCELDVPVVCVQDIFLTSDKDVETENLTWFTSKKLWGKNVGILIKTSPDISMADFEVDSEYLCFGNVHARGHTIKVFCCCLPPHTESEMFGKVTERLTDLVKSLPEETLYVIAGDFNTHLRITDIEILQFDEGDANALFLINFMKEFGMEISHMHKSSVSVVSEKGRRNTSHVLISPSCLSKYSQRRYTRWIPYFESGVVTLHLTVSDQGEQNSSHVSGKGKFIGMVEHVDGSIHVTKKVCKLNKIHSTEINGDEVYLVSNEFMRKDSEHQSDLSDEILAKYKNSPPSMEELTRILGDEFTLYYGYLQESALPKGCAGVLAASFDALNRGGLTVECVEVLGDKTESSKTRVVKFRWNGIVVHVQEGGASNSFNRTIAKGQSVFIFNLGQHCFTVKAKRSFYNNSLPPLCKDKNKLKEVLRLVRRSEFPSKATVEDVNKFIDDFFKEDTYLELLFGPDFSRDKFLEPIKMYATSKNLSVRWFRSTTKVRRWDNLAVFIERTPYEIRKRLMETKDHQDLKFHLLPPCGVENNYFDWTNNWSEKIIPDSNHWEEKVIPDKFYHCWGKKADAAEDLEEHKDEENKPEAGDKAADKSVMTDLEETAKGKDEGVKRKIGIIEEEVEHVGGLIHKIKRFGILLTGNTTIPLVKGYKDWMSKAKVESDLPSEIAEKYKETCIPDEELFSILGDEFTLYYGFGRESSVNTGTMEILAESLESLNRGGLTVENIDIFKGHLPHSRMIRFKWNGIVVHEEEGDTQVSFRTSNEVGRLALISKLGRKFYSVRAKKSFYKKSLPPKGQEVNKLKEVLKVVKKTDLPETPTIADVKKFIDDFFQENAHLELVFTPDSTYKSFMESIKKYATEKDLGFRYFKSSPDGKRCENLAVFVKRSPVEVRERLKELPDQQDRRFYLIPPCEEGKTYQDWSNEWVKAHVPEESKAEPVRTPQTKDNKRKLGSSPPFFNPSLRQGRHSSDGRSVGAPVAKRVKAEMHEKPRWEEVAPLIILWPINIRSENENNSRIVLESNFPTEVLMEGKNRVAVFLTLPLRNRRSKRFFMCVRNDVINATTQALNQIVRHSTVIKHTPQYLPPGGQLPDFIRYNIPCRSNPRTYILLSKYDTGPLTRANITEIFYNLKSSFNEDVFFDRSSFTYEEKLMLLDLAPKHGLKVRHFGEDHRLVYRFVCVYKTKPKDLILDEVLRMRDYHPKYMLASHNMPRQPPHHMPRQSPHKMPRQPPHNLPRQLRQPPHMGRFINY